MKNSIHTFFLLAIITCLACNQETKKSNIQSLDPKKWNCKKIENNTICIPLEWKFIEQDKIFFFAAPEKDYTYVFFTIGKYNLKILNLDVKGYLKAIYSELRKNTEEVFIGYTLKKVRFTDKYCYYAEYFSKVGNDEYKAYSMIFEKNGVLYDLLLKRKKDINVNHKTVFNDIMFNFKIDGKPFFSREDKIEKTEIIDLSKL